MKSVFKHFIQHSQHLATRKLNSSILMVYLCFLRSLSRIDQIFQVFLNSLKEIKGKWCLTRQQWLGHEHRQTDKRLLTLCLAGSWKAWLTWTTVSRLRRTLISSLTYSCEMKSCSHLQTSHPQTRYLNFPKKHFLKFCFYYANSVLFACMPAG